LSDKQADASSNSTKENLMFKELVPLLRNRAVLITLALVEDDKIRVSVVPKKIKEDENDALTTPFWFTGTAEELEAELGPTLVSYTGFHLQLKSTLENAQAEMDAAAKAAKAKAHSTSKTPPKKEGTSNATAKPAQAETPAAPAKPAPPKTASLFNMPPIEQPAAAPPPAALVEQENGDEDDILAEINEEDTQVDVNEDLDEAA
jgi:PRTRC genetic system protein E